MKEAGRGRLVFFISVALLAGGGVLLACGSVLDPPEALEPCEGGSCDGDVSPEPEVDATADVVASDTSAISDGSTGAKDGSTPKIDASDGGVDATVPPPCADGGPSVMLDPTFGDGGLVYLNAAPGAASYANAVVVQPDGKIVLAGTIGGSTSTRFALVRLAPAGALDTSFGDAGVVETPLHPGTVFGATAVALSGDGRILAGGLVYLDVDAGTTDFAITRYSPGGTLDGTFGDGGVAFAGFGPPQHGFVSSIAVLPDGHVLAGGYRGSNLVGSRDYAVARFNPNGSLDGTFGSNGKVMIDIRSSLDGTGAMIAQADGKLLVAGSSTLPTKPSWPQDLSAVRLNADGSLDPSFGAGGKVVLGLATPSRANAVALDGTGRIVLGGTTGSSNTDFGVFRLTSTGTLDSTFGSGGFVSSDFCGNYDVITSLFIQPDGKYLAVGRRSSPGGAATAFARFQSDGAPDLGFGPGGKVVPPTPSGFYERAAAYGGGRVTVAGQFNPGGAETWMGVTRYVIAP